MARARRTGYTISKCTDSRKTSPPPGSPPVINHTCWVLWTPFYFFFSFFLRCFKVTASPSSSSYFTGLNWHGTTWIMSFQQIYVLLFAGWHEYPNLIPIWDKDLFTVWVWNRKYYQRVCSHCGSTAIAMWDRTAKDKESNVQIPSKQPSAISSPTEIHNAKWQ